MLSQLASSFTIYSTHWSVDAHTHTQTHRQNDVFHVFCYIFQNMESFVRHMEMRNTSSIFASLEINASLLPMPAVILLIVASRGFLFWCLNILSIPIVLTNGKTIIYGGKGMQETSDDRDFRYARNHPRGNNNNNILEVSGNLNESQKNYLLMQETDLSHTESFSGNHRTESLQWSKSLSSVPVW